MLIQLINGNVLTPAGWIKDGSVIINDGKILEVTNSELAVIGAKVIDVRGMHVVPGFVSMHIHGGAGHDFTEATDEAFSAIVSAHARHGSTSIFPTLSSTTFDTIRQAAGVCERMMQHNPLVQGLHIEGPYLNTKMAGEWKDVLCLPDPGQYVPLVEQAHCIRRWDISPELPGSHEFARFMHGHGILTALTHTEAEYEDVKEVYQAGFTHAAHFYNAMPGFHKRREYKYEGTVESVYLVDPLTIELIADGKHLPPTILKLAYKLKGVERTCLVTDALKFAANDEGLPIDDPRYVVEDGVCKWADRSSLAGSMATMDLLIRVMVNKAGIPLADAVRMASETPARIIGIADRKGSLAKGKDADIVVLDNELQVRCVFSGGEVIPGTNTLIH